MASHSPSAACVLAYCRYPRPMRRTAIPKRSYSCVTARNPPRVTARLNCQGLNRALALPAVIAAKFGKPDAIYAPDPGQQKDDSGHPYYYVRPLATIEPTAIQFQMPVQTPYGFAQIDQARHSARQSVQSQQADCRCVGAQADREVAASGDEHAWRQCRRCPQLAQRRFRQYLYCSPRLAKRHGPRHVQT